MATNFKGKISKIKLTFIRRSCMPKWIRMSHSRWVR